MTRKYCPKDLKCCTSHKIVRGTQELIIFWSAINFLVEFVLIGNSLLQPHLSKSDSYSFNIKDIHKIKNSHRYPYTNILVIVSFLWWKLISKGTKVLLPEERKTVRES